MSTRPSTSRTLQALLALFWKQPLYALPFALFFGLQFGHNLHDFRLSYEVALALAFPIGLGLWAARYVIVPRLNLPPHDTGQWAVWREVFQYVAMAVAGAYVGALAVHLWILRDFLGSPRANFMLGAYTLLFSALFSALSYAQVFYRRSLERARAIEAMRAELAQAELRALRAQVNPHFLFNTLNSIAALIPVNPPAAEETTTRLAELFRYVLRASEREYSTLGEELGFALDYLGIEQTRLGERLKVTQDVMPGLESLPVPSLILQPLVENAVRHGVAARLEGGTVHLAARRVGPLLGLEVRDDGPGMSAGATGGDGFGLRSVQDRLGALGPPHALEIDSKPGAGTCVRITLPCAAPETRSTQAPGNQPGRREGVLR